METFLLGIAGEIDEDSDMKVVSSSKALTAADA